MVISNSYHMSYQGFMIGYSHYFPMVLCERKQQDSNTPVT